MAEIYSAIASICSSNVEFITLRGHSALSGVGGGGGGGRVGGGGGRAEVRERGGALGGRYGEMCCL